MDNQHREDFPTYPEGWSEFLDEMGYPAGGLGQRVSLYLKDIGYDFDVRTTTEKLDCLRAEFLAGRTYLEQYYG